MIQRKGRQKGGAKKGKELDNYEVLRLIQKGRVSEVYLVRHRRTLRNFCMKVLDKNDETKEIYSNEVRVLKNYLLPGIPKFVDYGEDANSFYIITEYIPGFNLQEVLLQGITQEKVIDICHSVASILFSLHSCGKGIVYLDLKPEHIIVSNDMVFLIDFGSAIPLENVTEKTRIFGTGRYVAPEIKEGIISVKADVYSFGRLLEWINESMSLDISFTNMLTERELSKRTDSMEIVLQYLMQQKNTDLPYKRRIAVLGSDRRVGTTYVAIIVTAVLNLLYEKACYLENSNNRFVMRLYKSFDEVFCFSEIKKGCAILKPSKSRFLQYDKQESNYNNRIIENAAIEVIDIGVYEERFNPGDYDGCILVLGAKDWEIEQSESIASILSCENVVYVVTYETKEATRRLVKKIDKEVFLIPDNKDVYRPSEDQKKVITKILTRLRGRKT